ncbi:MAG: polyhydroxyalkanoate synthesis repressor PhaR [Chromatiales bacterium]|nr:polyhydroxyalkanoate synthesis repressor PhaR [Chromatiales bacterium]
MAEPRLIKKYPNRRLYDTEVSRYITLSDIRELVMKAVPFKVVDAHSNEDITRGILLQIIIEQESGGEPLFSTEVLSQMIRFYGDTVQNVFTSYLEKSLDFFGKQQEQFERQMRDAMHTNPVDALNEMTQRNLAAWKDLQDSFFKASGFGGKADTQSKKD